MPKVYLDDNGEPVGAAAPKVYLDDNGEPVGAKASTVKPVSESEPDTYWGGVKRSLVQQLNEAIPPPREGETMHIVHGASPRVEKFMSTPLANPTGIDSIDGFLSPAGLAMVAAGGVGAMKGKISLPEGSGPKALQMTGRMLKNVGEFDMTHPLKSTVGKLGAHLEGAATRAIEGQGSPNVKTTSNWLPERPAPVEPQAPPVDISTPVKAGNMSQADIRARIDAVRANGGLPASTEAQMPTIRGQLRSTPPQVAVEPTQTAAPITEPVMPEAWKPLVGEPSPMQKPRVDIGAEKVGRSAGLTKEHVRMQTEPIVGEAKGEASPILPEMPLQRIIDTLKALPKGGPEREAYVARATSGKARGQVENIRRTLEHLGLIVPIAAGTGAAIRSGVMDRLRGSEPTKDTQSRQ